MSDKYARLLLRLFCVWIGMKLVNLARTNYPVEALNVYTGELNRIRREIDA